MSASDRRNTARKAANGTGKNTAVHTRQVPMRSSIQPISTATAAHAAIASHGAGPSPNAHDHAPPTAATDTATQAQTHATVPASAHGGERPAPEAMFFVHPSTSWPGPSGYMRNPIASPPPTHRTGSPRAR